MQGDRSQLRPFSAILNLESGIAQFIQTIERYDVKLYAPEMLKVEIQRHHRRLISISKLTSDEVTYARDRLYKFIEFIDDDAIPFDQYVQAMRIVRDIDPDDVNFVALNDYMKEILWTGDMELYYGLKKKGYKNVVIFEDIKKKYNL